MTLNTVSLFCGAGGESAGKHLALQDLGVAYDAVAVNHWDRAVEIHRLNFPHVDVRQEDLTEVTAVDLGIEHIDLLWASPSCTHHSRARGGKPRDDQQRSHADEVIDRWLAVADVPVMLLENVPEFEQWGPVDEAGKVVQARKGEYFRRFVARLEGMGYEAEWRVLCAADYGDPTTRRRLFLQAVRDGKGVHWPMPTHQPMSAARGLFTPALPAWRPAAECIDWSIPVPSIFGRPKPLAAATMRRIEAGLFALMEDQRSAYRVPGNPSAAAFLVSYYGNGGVVDLRDPLPTVTTVDRFALVVADQTTGDISMRMLQPRELARAMGFPESFALPANKRDAVKMIGNACPVQTVRALVRAVMAPRVGGEGQ